MEESVSMRIVFPYYGFEQTPLHGYSTAATLINGKFIKFKMPLSPHWCTQGWSKCCSKAALTALPQGNHTITHTQKKHDTVTKNPTPAGFNFLASKVCYNSKNF